MEEYFNCLNMERDDAALEAKRVLNEWNDAVTYYNAQ
jgi:hypothetical protein